MPGGKKKKSKPAANPARGFATTSVQSKPKAEKVAASSTDASTVESPASLSTPPDAEGKSDLVPSAATARELHELSPEELEAQLEASELQQFVEQHAAKIKKDVSRQVSRLQTDRRVLRSQADHMSVRDWLPDELTQHIIDFTLETRQRQQLEDGHQLPTGDDLLAKVWQLRCSLLELEVPEKRVNEAIEYILSEGSAINVDGHLWGLGAALDWLALNVPGGELLPYDARKPTAKINFDDQLLDQGHHGSLMNGNAHESGENSPQSPPSQSYPSTPNDDIDVSDLDSDIEPEELLSVYLRTKARLYDLNPEAEQFANTRSGFSGKGTPPTSSGEQKLHRKLKSIEGDVLFDQREADALWSSKRIELAKDQAERRRLKLANTLGQDSNGGSFHPPGIARANGVSNEAQTTGEQLLKEAAELEEDDDVLGGMFDTLPGLQTSAQGVDPTDGLDYRTAVTSRDFGRITGLTPRRIFEETCKARDNRVKVSCKMVSPTTYASRHSITINWSKEQNEVVNAPYLPWVLVNCQPKATTITMTEIATPDTAQSEACVSTIALFVIFAGSVKEEKAHLRLPPAFRDLWGEMTQYKRESSDAGDRKMVKQLRKQIETLIQPDEEDPDDSEVVFNASLRRRIAGTSGASSPITRPGSARPPQTEDQELLRSIWTQKASSAAYQRMLTVRMNLPMFQSRQDALDAIERNQITIVVGDTGSGKSTQVPSLILEHELSQGRPCKIYCTEPRRISAISLAQRVSEELGERRGDVGTSRSLVGYAIRLETHTSAETRLVYATVGIVLRMLENNDGLKDITHLIIDEVHERSIDTDFLLIVLKSLVLRRPDLKVVLMSATVDAQKFSTYLDGAPIVSVPGRTFPVQAMFLEDAIEVTGHTNEDASKPAGDDTDDVEPESQTKGADADSLMDYSKRTKNTLMTYDEYRIDYSLIVKLLQKVAYDEHFQNFSSAVLIFLPGIAEIRQLNDMLVGHPAFLKAWRIYPLHSSFSSEDQQAAFEVPPQGIRKIVLATNIAETGITIPDVTCVIDTGKHKEMRFDERRQMSRLIQSFIARANAKQRRGRAGRVQEGICFHLFTRYRHDNLMIEQQTPEMLRLSLQDLVMRVKICKLGNIEQALSAALDPPSAKNIRRAVDALIEVDALTPDEELTHLGTQLAKLPLDAQLGKLILLSSIYGCLDFGLTIAAMLSSKSPFVSPMHARKQADSVRLGYKRGNSDLLTAYNAYCAWRKICTTPGSSEYTFCSKNFLSAQNLAGIEDLKGQLLTSLADTGFVRLGQTEKAAFSKLRYHSRQRHFVALPQASSTQDDNDMLITSVVGWAFYPKVIKQEGKGWRNVANNQTVGLHPTSVNRSSLPSDVKYLSFYSIMQSSSRFTNAQETSPMTDFALTLLAGDAVFHMYAGVIVIDGNRLRLKVRDWETMIVLKTLRTKFREVLVRLFKHPGRDLSDNQRRWMEIFEALFRGHKQQA